MDFRRLNFACIQSAWPKSCKKDISQVWLVIDNLKGHIPQKVSGFGQEQWDWRGDYRGLSRGIKYSRNGQGRTENNKEESEVLHGHRGNNKEKWKNKWLLGMSMAEMEGRKEEGILKTDLLPLLREEKVNCVFPTSNFQTSSHSFPSILAVFLGLRVGHFCSDFRSFYCTVSSTVKRIREHAVTWHSELPAWFYLLSLGLCVLFYIFLAFFSHEMGLAVIVFPESIFSPSCFLQMWLFY